MTNHAHNVQPYSSSIPFGTQQSALIFDHLHKCAGITFAFGLRYLTGNFYNAYLLSYWKTLCSELP